MMGSVTAEIVQATTLLGTATAAQIAELLPDANPNTVASALGKSIKRGELVREKMRSKGQGLQYHYSVNPDPERKPPPKDPSPRGLEARLEDALQRVAVLEVWKANAIERYPKLGVDPKVLEARAIVAKVLMDMHDPALAKSVEAGEKDCSPLMRATLVALGV